MGFKDKTIRIDCWSGKLLYIGEYDCPTVDKILDANRCPDCIDDVSEDCPECNGTGYSGDFEVSWVDESDKEDCNVYEHINY